MNFDKIKHLKEYKQIKEWILGNEVDKQEFLINYIATASKYVSIKVDYDCLILYNELIELTIPREFFNYMDVITLIKNPYKQFLISRLKFIQDQKGLYRNITIMPDDIAKDLAQAIRDLELLGYEIQSYIYNISLYAIQIVKEQKPVNSYIKFVLFLDNHNQLKKEIQFIEQMIPALKSYEFVSSINL